MALLPQTPGRLCANHPWITGCSSSQVGHFCSPASCLSQTHLCQLQKCADRCDCVALEQPLWVYWSCYQESRADLYSCDVCSRYSASDHCPVCSPCLPIAPISTSVSSSGLSAPFDLKCKSLVRSLQFKIIINEGASGFELSLFFSCKKEEFWPACCYLVAWFFLTLGRCTGWCVTGSILCWVLTLRSCAKCCSCLAA